MTDRGRGTTHTRVHTHTYSRGAVYLIFERHTWLVSPSPGAELRPRGSQSRMRGRPALLRKSLSAAFTKCLQSLVSAVNTVQIGSFVSCIYQGESAAKWYIALGRYSLDHLTESYWNPTWACLNFDVIHCKLTGVFDQWSPFPFFCKLSPLVFSPFLFWEKRDVWIEIVNAHS